MLHKEHLAFLNAIFCVFENTIKLNLGLKQTVLYAVFQAIFWLVSDSLLFDMNLNTFQQVAAY